MSTVEVLPEPLDESATRGVRLYTMVCMVAALAMALPLLARGLGTGALLPALAGLLLPLVRWRAGVIVLLLMIGWIVLADALGLDPLVLAGRILSAILSLFFIVRSRLWLHTNPSPRLAGSVPPLDIFFCCAVLVWIGSYCRLLGVMGVIFPVDRRRRSPVTKKAKGGGPSLGPVLEQKRSPSLVSSEEPGRLMLAAALCVVLGQLVLRWLARRDPSVDLTYLTTRGIDLGISGGVWRLIVLVWIVGVMLILATGVLGYLGQLRLTPAEAALHLQDQVWRQTRREQARLNRWLAWAEKREAKRRERK